MQTASSGILPVRTALLPTTFINLAVVCAATEPVSISNDTMTLVPMNVG